MTLQEARDTGQGCAVRFGKPFVIYRLPAWPPEVYGLVAVDRGLPPQAQQIERVEKAHAKVVKDQGSLF